jgi:hypothetical protein
MTLECRCSNCGAVLQTTNADPVNAEIERLRALVRSAYSEGFSEGMNEHTKFHGGKPWEDSRAQRALG